MEVVLPDHKLTQLEIELEGPMCGKGYGKRNTKVLDDEYLRKYLNHLINYSCNEGQEPDGDWWTGVKEKVKRLIINH